MILTATGLESRLGRMLEQRQREPVAIESSEGGHGLPISDDLPTHRKRDADAQAFCSRHKEWVDEQNRMVERHGIPFEEFRPW